MPRPLDGIVVVDFTTMVAGPAATRLLADCGAEVIKIEACGEGDLLRGRYNIDLVSRYTYGLYNAGKKSISLDLKTEAGMEVVRRLIAKADVVVENFRPGVMARLGLDYPGLAKAHPKLIYCSISGFGQTGPLAERPAYAPIVHAYSGLDIVVATAEEDRHGVPLKNAVLTADVAAGNNAFAAIQTALLHRERNGPGSFIDVTLMESTMQMIGLQYQQAQANVEPEPLNYPPIKSSDGYVIIPLIAPRTVFEVFKILGHADWVSDPQYATRDGMRTARALIKPELAAWVAQHTSAECDEIMARVGVPCSIYKEAKDIWDEPQSKSRGSFREVHDAIGAFQVLNTPFQISGAACEAQPYISGVGEDTDAILAELGYGAADIERLQQQKAFGAAA